MWLVRVILTVTLCAGAIAPANAGFVTYTDKTQFLADASFYTYSVSNVDFDGVDTSGGPVPLASGSSLGGVTFAYDFGGVSLTVTDVYDTTSPANFLGTDDGDVLQDGDNITFSFSARTGFGLFVISGDALLDGDVELTIGSETVSLIAGDQQGTLSDGSGYWFVGLLSDDGSTFNSISLNTLGGGGAFLYNVDDLVLTKAGTTSTPVVPEPTTLALGLFGLTGGLLLRKRARSPHRPA